MDEMQKVRMILGNPSESVIDDDTIEALLEEFNDDVWATAASCAGIIARHLGLKASKSIADVKYEYLRQAELWKSFMHELEEKQFGLSKPFFGGTSVADKEVRAEDEDRPKSDFWRGMFEGDYPDE